jgi:uncharacterized protein YoxC
MPRPFLRGPDFRDHRSRYDEIPPWVDALMRRVDLIVSRTGMIMATMQELRDAVRRNTSVDDSVLAMLQGISQQLKDAQAQNDPQAISDLIKELDANTQKMTDAVTANTPAEEEPAPTPEPSPSDPNTPPA